ncbi:MAG TPA: hypothetical protein VFU15_10655 [Bacteroidia bacterium]|nr:hypothetical protein [Bacteroidia bacterium]
MRIPRSLFFLSLVLFSVSLRAQLYVGIKFMGLSFHPGKNTNAQFYDVTIGKKKKLVLNFGVALTAEYMVYRNFSVKYDQALFRDCAGKFAGMSMFNVRYTIDMRDLGLGSAGIGPFFFYRKTWTDFDGYDDEGFFRLGKNRKWQTKFVWYGGELEHDYPLKNSWWISTNLLPGIPVVYALAPGMRYGPVR